jgi:hypothetical protein
MARMASSGAIFIGELRRFVGRYFCVQLNDHRMDGVGEEDDEEERRFAVCPFFTCARCKTEATRRSRGLPATRTRRGACCGLGQAELLA